MQYYFDIKQQLNSIISKNSIDFSYAASIDLEKNNDYKDVTDGRIYKNFLSTEEGHHIRSGNGFTFSINTDGCNPSNKSLISIWPVFLTINEIPIGDRYCMENVIIAGIYIKIYG